MDSFTKDLVAGGAAGFTVDISIFPIDTVKTRLQAKAGFIGSGGFHGLYRGLGIVSAGSIPGSAVFFSIYEGIRRIDVKNKKLNTIKNNFIAPAVGEFAACLIRVPVEVIKQRCQATSTISSRENVLSVMNKEGIRGFYRGFGATVFREIPFSVIQFPLWEYLKHKYSQKVGLNRKLGFFESGMCGACSGAIAAAATTPMGM